MKHPHLAAWISAICAILAVIPFLTGKSRLAELVPKPADPLPVPTTTPLPRSIADSQPTPIPSPKKRKTHDSGWALYLKDFSDSEIAAEYLNKIKQGGYPHAFVSLNQQKRFQILIPGFSGPLEAKSAFYKGIDILSSTDSEAVGDLSEEPVIEIDLSEY